MNIIKNIIIFIKRLFNRQEKIETLEETKSSEKYDNEDSFINSLKINTNKKITNKKIETLICEGDGLGIQKKISS